MLIIGIAGGTGCGKTPVVNTIADELNNSDIVVISQDCSYVSLVVVISQNCNYVSLIVVISQNCRYISLIVVISQN